MKEFAPLLSVAAGLPTARNGREPPIALHKRAPLPLRWPISSGSGRQSGRGGDGQVNANSVGKVGKGANTLEKDQFSVHESRGRPVSGLKNFL